MWKHKLGRVHLYKIQWQWTDASLSIVYPRTIKKTCAVSARGILQTWQRSQNRFFTLIWKFQLYCPNDKTISLKYNYKRWNTTFVFQRRKNFYFLVLAEIFISLKKTVIATWLTLFLSLLFSLLSVTKTGLVCNPKIRNDLVLSWD